MSKFRAIIFDLDGTLVDSEPIWELAEAELFRDRGIIYGEDARQQVIGLRMDEFFQKLIEIYNLEESAQSLIDDLIQRMLTKIPDSLQAKKGAQELLDWAAAEAIPFGIASSSPMSIIEASVRSQGWQNCISYRYTAEMVERGKPAPDIYLFAASELGVAPQDCLAIEDSPVGATAAVAAGMTCFVVPDSHTSAEKFSDITPHVFTSLTQILECLNP